ncbi:ATP-binding protein [Thiorhodovibrio winogradskyi]|uniref:ATP-binding protein n=1 Tax=Thiorhodovibrio winogradskyi TaxID=77007 RepID=UPI002E29B00A|nr:ATP-binding protein [Thiorhodovibrio winogradskyi]
MTEPPKAVAPFTPTWLVVDAEADVAAACRAARTAAERLDFSRAAAYEIATATSELASNLLLHAGGGRLRLATALAPSTTGARLGLEVCALDQGPGITDLAAALREGHSTAGGLGCGLSGARRLMDGFRIASRPGRGTCVRVIKWR